MTGKMTDVSIDIETMGKGQNAALCQIGFVCFNRHTGELGSTVLVNVDIMDAVACGGVITADTVNWWSMQGGFRYAMSLPIVSVSHALKVVRDNLPELPLWANGDTFDIAVVERLYIHLGQAVPWAYNAPRDLRTLRDVCAYSEILTECPAVPTHNALDDAIAQAKEIVDRIGRIRQLSVQV